MGMAVTCAGQTGQGGLSSVDAAMRNVMRRHQVPGGSLAIAFNGKPIYARGYGLANTSANSPVQPDSPFREASVGNLPMILRPTTTDTSR